MITKTYYGIQNVELNSLTHYGRKGMKWGQHIFGKEEASRKVRAYMDGGLGREKASEMLGTGRRKAIEDKVSSWLGRAKSTGQKLGYKASKLAKKAGFKGSDKTSAGNYYTDFDNRFKSIYTQRTGVNTSTYNYKTSSPIDAMLKDATGQLFKKKSGDTSITNDLKNCNPFFGKIEGTTNNCTKCAATMELRKRGYDFQSGFLRDGGDSKSFTDWFHGATRDVNSWADTAKKIASYGAGASGVLDGRYAKGGGHEVHWTVMPDRSIRVEDGQNGRMFSSLTQVVRAYGFDTSKGVGHSRLDDKQPNWSALNRDSVVRVEPYKNPYSQVSKDMDVQKSISKIMKKFNMSYDQVDEHLMTRGSVVATRIIDTATKRLYNRL